MRDKNSSTFYYSLAFKQRVVAEFERGGMSKEALAAKHGIKGHTTLLKWCRRYGKLCYDERDIIQLGRTIMDPAQRKIKELEAKLAYTQAALRTAELGLIAYDKLIEIAEKKHGISLKKGVAKQ
jgi:transposase-like protein